MFKALFKTAICVLLLTVLGGQPSYGDVRYYKYDGNMPFVKMMLTMMEAMGIIDKVSPYGAYGLSAYPGSRWNGQNNLYSHNLYSNNIYSSYLNSRNPYLRALALRKLGTGYGRNPFVRSPWLQSPWASSAYNPQSPLWGNPSWGVLPRSGYLSSPYSSRWSAYDLSGWVDEPWETSIWNDEAEDDDTSEPGPPIIQNFYNVPDDERHENRHEGWPEGRSEKRPEKQQGKPSPLSKRLHAKRSKKSAHKHNVGNNRKHSPLRKKAKEKPCITEFCGLKKPDLEGLWVAQSGEMLGINDERYLWTDGVSRYLSGDIKVQNEYLLTRADDHDELIRFKYKLAGDNLLTLKPDGTMREFIRVPMYRHGNEYRYFYPGQGQ